MVVGVFLESAHTFISNFLEGVVLVCFFNPKYEYYVVSTRHKPHAIFSLAKSVGGEPIYTASSAGFSSFKHW